MEKNNHMDTFLLFRGGEGGGERLLMPPHAGTNEYALNYKIMFNYKYSKVMRSQKIFKSVNKLLRKDFIERW